MVKGLPSNCNRPSLKHMNFHPFAILMVATFVGALATLLAGVTGMGRANPQGEAARAATSNKLMALRVALCLLLLAEILVYVAFIR